MQRYFLYLAYDGTSYHGWQIQPNGISVQEVLQKALATLLRQPVSITGAGRTDTGVHARMMVAHFDFEYADDPVRRIDGRWLTDKLNRLLPPDISIYKTVPVAATCPFRCLVAHLPLLPAFRQVPVLAGLFLPSVPDARFWEDERSCCCIVRLYRFHQFQQSEYRYEDQQLPYHASPLDGACARRMAF